MRRLELQQQYFTFSGLIPALFLLAACTTSGGNIFSDAAPKANDPVPGTATSVRPGSNPNANTKLINTQNRLSDYCPSLRIRAGTESLRSYKGKDKENPDNVRYQATFTKVARECTYVGENLEITVGARGRVITGPAGKTGNFRMPIRVAVQEGTCSRHFKLYQQPININSGSTTATFEFVGEKIIIPAPKSLNIKMYIGFDEGPYGKSSTKECAG